jgi:hypothetical protein
MMTSLNAAMNETLMSMHGQKYKTTQADYDQMQETYKQMFEDKHAQLDRDTFLALAKIMTAQVVLQVGLLQINKNLGCFRIYFLTRGIWFGI